MSRNSDGTFAKGNKFGKGDLTKEIAQQMVSSEMWVVSKLIADMTKGELEECMAEHKDNMSLLSIKIIEKIKKGDLKAIQWFVEMMMGRATQQITHTTPKGKAFKLAYTIDGSN